MELCAGDKCSPRSPSNANYIYILHLEKNIDRYSGSHTFEIHQIVKLIDFDSSDCLFELILWPCLIGEWIWVGAISWL